MDLLKKCGRCTGGYVIPPMTSSVTFRYKCPHCLGAGKVPMRVLIIDDDALKLRAIRRTVRNLVPGAPVAEAGSFDEAKPLIHICDVILTDMDFPLKKGGPSVPNAGFYVKRAAEEHGKSPIVISGFDVPDGFDGNWITFAGGFKSQLEQYLQEYETI